MSGETIGLISLGMMVLTNIIIVAFGYGRLIEMTKNIKESLDSHCSFDERRYAEITKRIERLENKALETAHE